MMQVERGGGGERRENGARGECWGRRGVGKGEGR